MKGIMYSDKDANLTWSVLLHYIVKIKDSKMPAILSSSTMNCCRVPVNKVS